MIKRIPIDLEKHQIPKGEVVIIEKRCKGCSFCVEFCPKDVIEMSTEFNEKGYHFPIIVKGKENSCIACRFCEYVCPDFAIFVKEQTRPVTADDIEDEK